MFSFFFLFISINFVKTFPDKVPESACQNMMPDHTVTTAQKIKSPYYINPIKINTTSKANESFRSN